MQQKAWQTKEWTRGTTQRAANLRERIKHLWPPGTTLSYNHHTRNSRPSCCNIHTHNQPAYG